LLLTLRLELLPELERLDVAGVTLLTDELLDCCETLRVELELPEPATLRLELLPATLRLELDPATLRLELDPATLRLAEDPATLRLSVEVLFTDLDAVVVLTLRLELEPNAAERLAVVLRLRFLSHPPSLILRLGLKVSALL
jgi:hypothetical protein